MSSFMPASRSFFKSQGVDFYTEGSNITFPCFECGAMAIMDTTNTHWQCASGHSGNLKNLIELSKHGVPDAKVYSPRKGRAQIYKSVSRLLTKYKGTMLGKELEQLQSLLVEYFDSQKPPV